MNIQICSTNAAKKFDGIAHMIYQALETVANELNNYLVERFNKGGQKAAVLNSIVGQDGSIAENSRDRIVLSLINLEHETALQFNPIFFQNKDKTNTKKPENMPYNFNLDVLVTAVFEAPNYDEGLKHLSEAIYFFQTKNTFNIENTPQLGMGIQELTFELIKLSYHQEHSLWGAIGAKYMPSVLFKIRMLSFQSGQLIDVPQIAQIAPAKDKSSITHLNPSHTHQN